ncbi:MAG: T9SS type A sorting domain-containing protein [Bacteroidetes bacterium]|nr:T9SS type A sorting domain-containing protein [Bacteroidota bacterium]
MTCSKPTFPLPTSLVCALAALIVTHATAQSPCPEDSLALNVTVTTDAWGYEMYWELLALGSECGDGDALLWGGNPEVGCGEDVPGLPGDAYGNNVVVSSPTLCVSEEDSLVLVHRDSYGDGGSLFSIALAGMEVYAFGGSGSGDDWTFQTALLAGDMPCLAESIVADGPSWVGSTVEATVSPNEPSPPALGCGTYGGWCESGLNRTMWLIWEVPEEGGVYSITTCNEGTSFDTQLAMWEVEDCADFSTYALVNANDDIGCEFGAYRSGFLTPCLEGGETFYLQIDGWYGEIGDVEVSITSTSPEEWAVSASVQDLSCSLATDFNPNGAIDMNTNVGPNSVDWQWTGPFGFTSSEAVLGPLLPGVYNVSASFCGQSFAEQFEVEEPAPIEAQVTLTADCDSAAMSGAVVVVGGQGEVDATWSIGTFEAFGAEVFGLPSGLCQVDVVDENGCSTSEWVWVDAVGVPEVDLGPGLFGCAGDAFTLLAPLGNNLSYTWTTGQAGPLVVVQTENPGTLVVGVEVSDAAGCSDTDAIILTLDDCASGLEDVLGSEGVSALDVYPNPFENELSLEWPLSKSLQGLRVRDMSGKEVPCIWTRQGDRVTATLDVPAGMYMMTCDEIPGGVRVVRR